MGEIEIFSQRLKEIREDMKMTQKEFSSFLDIKQQTLSGYENGKAKPPLDIAKEISFKCEVSLDWLCGLSDEKPLKNKKVIKTYKDVIEILLLLSSNKDLDFSIGENVEIHLWNGSAENSFDSSVLKFHDEKICKFISDFHKMNELLMNTSIDEEVFEIWIEKTLKQYDINIEKSADNTDYTELDDTDLPF